MPAVRWRAGSLRALDRGPGPAGLPIGVLTVNVLGCLLIGVVLGTTGRGQFLVGENARLLLATGVYGGFTTFSAFSVHALTLVQQGRMGTALLHVTLSVGLGLAATAAGLGLTRWVA